MNIRDLVQGVKAIPATVTTLQLANNSLENLSQSDLTQFHQALPDTITSINYGHITKPLFNGLKPSVKTVHIYDDYDNRLMILNGIPSTVDYITINGGPSISLAHYKLLYNSDFYNQLTKVNNAISGAPHKVISEWQALRFKLEKAANTFLIDGSKEAFKQAFKLTPLLEQLH